MEMTGNSQTVSTCVPAGSYDSAACMETRQLLLKELIAKRKILLCEAIRILGSHEQAEDVVQDAALRCLTSLSITDIRTKPHGLLRRMVRNIALDHWRRAAREMPMADAGCDLPSPYPCIDSEGKLQARQELEQVVDMLDQLPERERCAIVGHRLNGRKQTEIATEIGISPARVHAPVQRSHRHLITQLDIA